MPTPPGFDWSPAAKLKKYVKMGDLLIATGIEYIDGDKMRFDGKTVYILNNGSGGLVFESPSWWTTQIEIMANKWCDLTKENFRTNYRTNLDVSGDIARDTAQEMATLSRLIYGLSSAYLMTGNNRFLRNAADGVKFQREAFRRISSDGLHVFWGFGLRDGKIVWPSQNGMSMDRYCCACEDVG